MPGSNSQRNRRKQRQRSNRQRRAEAVQCYWCGFSLCHLCRQTAAPAVASCNGNRNGLCDSAATRDHLIPRSHDPDRSKYVGNLTPPSVVACHWCNHSRSDLYPHEIWIEHLQSKNYQGAAHVRKVNILNRLAELTFQGET